MAQSRREDGAERCPLSTAAKRTRRLPNVEKQDTPRMVEQLGLMQLVGSWRLVSVGATYTDTKERIEFYGPHPTGYMALSPNGRIIFLFTRADRTPPQTDADRATLFSAMTAYTGRVRTARPSAYLLRFASGHRFDACPPRDHRPRFQSTHDCGNLGHDPYFGRLGGRQRSRP
jgi:Lipocalin-like domain